MLRSTPQPPLPHPTHPYAPRFARSLSRTQRRHGGSAWSSWLPRSGGYTRHGRDRRRAGILRGSGLQHSRAGNAQRAGSGERTRQYENLNPKTSDKDHCEIIEGLRFTRGHLGDIPADIRTGFKWKKNLNTFMIKVFKSCD